MQSSSYLDKRGPARAELPASSTQDLDHGGRSRQAWSLDTTTSLDHGRGYQQAHTLDTAIPLGTGTATTTAQATQSGPGSGPRRGPTVIEEDSTTHVSLQLTAGLELEMIHCFQEGRLFQAMDTEFPRRPVSIVKTLSESEERACRWKNYPLQKYRSWAIRDEDDNIWPIYDSALRVVQLAFQERQQGGGGFFDIQPTVGGKHGYNTRWTLATDASLEAYDTQELRQAIAGIGRQHLDDTTIGGTWSSSGVEVISPPLAVQDWTTLRKQLDWVLDGIRSGTKDTLATVDPTRCGLHVHIGTTPRATELSYQQSSWTTDDNLGSLELATLDHPRTTDDIPGTQELTISEDPRSTTEPLEHREQPNNSPLPLRLVQILAYICIIYEEEISRLHHPARRYRTTEIRSNRESFTPEPTDKAARRRWCPKRERFVGLRCNLTELHEIRHCLFDTVDASTDPLEVLLSYVGPGRGRIVNFESLRGRNGRAYTIEFRQHAATFGTTAILWWVRHCEAMVQMAYRLSKLSEDELWSIMPVNAWDDHISIEDLWALMRFNEAGRLYYRQVKASYDGLNGVLEGMPLFEEVCESDDDEGYESGD